LEQSPSIGAAARGGDPIFSKSLRSAEIF